MKVDISNTRNLVGKARALFFSLVLLVVTFSLSIPAAAQEAAAALAQKATELDQAGKRTEALPVWEKVATLRQADTWLLWRIGSGYRDDKKDIAAALPWFQKAVDIRADDPSLYFHVFAAADELDNQRIFDSYLELFSTEVKLAPSKQQMSAALESLSRAAWYLILRDRFEDALSVLSKADSWKVADGSWWYANASVRIFQAMGHKALVEGNAREAQNWYKKGQGIAQRFPNFADSLPKIDFAVLGQTARDWALIGKTPPSVVHRVAGVYLPRTRVDQVFSDGVRRTSVRDITERQKERSVFFEKLLNRLVEAWSGGKIQLSFDHFETDATVSSLHEGEFRGHTTRVPDYLSAQREDGTIPGDLYFELSKKYESIFMYWEGEGLANVATGGGLALPLVPFQIETPFRGHINMPINWEWSDYPNAFMHEFFHEIEAMYEIKTTHGFSNEARGQFPAWKGSGQLDYFRWHFRNTVIGDLARFQFSTKYPMELDDQTVVANQNAVKSIPRDKMKEAHVMAHGAWDEWWAGKKNTAGPAAIRALRLNPYHPEALRIAAEWCGMQQKDSDALNYWQRLLKVRPEYWIYTSATYLAHWKLKNFEMAEGLYREFLERYPQRLEVPATLVGLGRLLLESDEPSGALKAFSEALAFAGISMQDKAEAQLWTGYTFGEKQGDQKTGARWIRQAIANGYKDSFARDLLKAWGQ
ncbi:MAG: tetratricopeptide repeat protein [Leptolyngbya sp.]|nr:tetratricopeptide repeat protein [Candidatus Melainabacteria bacterium]